MDASRMFDVSGQAALVTGAGGGLGARFARVLAANGARVAVTARTVERAAGTVAAIEADGGTALGVALEVNDATSVTAAFDRVEAEWGPVTILVNNAGVAHGGRTTEVTVAAWRKVLGTDLDAPFFIAQECARRLIAAGTGGAIVNIASVYGLRVDKGVAAYATAKAGLIQLTRALALDWARYDIRVNAIAPGWFPTGMNADHLSSEAGEAIREANPMRRFGKEGDLDGALLLLVSDAGAYMTGAVIPVDGGHGL